MKIFDEIIAFLSCAIVIVVINEDEYCLVYTYLRNDLGNLFVFSHILIMMDQPTESENLEIRMQVTTSSSPTVDQQHTFVVENIEGRIRDSVKQNSMLSDESQTSMQSSSNSLVPDPDILASLESYAKDISTNIDVVLRNLRGSLNGMFIS